MGTFSKKHFDFIGVNKNGDKVWLHKPEWSCDHYWSVGQLWIFPHNWDPTICKDLESLTHWNTDYERSQKNMYDWFVDEFGEPTRDLIDSLNTFKNRKCNFTAKQIYLLCELMATVYHLTSVSSMTEIGGSRFTKNPCSELLLDKDLYNKVNSVQLPAIFKELSKLFNEVNKTDNKPFIGAGYTVKQLTKRKTFSKDQLQIANLFLYYEHNQ